MPRVTDGSGAYANKLAGLAGWLLVCQLEWLIGRFTEMRFSTGMDCFMLNLALLLDGKVLE